MSDKTKLTMKASADKIRSQIYRISDCDLVLFADVAFAKEFKTVKEYIEKVVEEHLENMPF